jgi:phosphoribosylaminoimidazolecarboxamide formyltransferase/IMP cyclohydrolase
MSTKRKLRAFISVTDKRNLEMWKQFTDMGHEIVSTGGTAKKLTELNIPNTSVESVTGFPEILDGRVKSMHPLIVGGMLGNIRKPKHVEQMLEHNIEHFDIVVVNLYDFDGNPSIENIDVGGPTALRSAAKNGGCVLAVTNPEEYELVLSQVMSLGEFSRHYRETSAINAFAITSKYDAAIEQWMRRKRLLGEPLFDDDVVMSH